MQMSKDCGIETAATKIVYDRNQNQGLLVERFDRQWDRVTKKIFKLHQEDACQFLDQYPANKYRISLREIAEGIEKFSTSPVVEIPKLLRQVAFSYIIGNGDMHAKNISLICNESKSNISLTPAYDMVSTFLYGDTEMALHLEGKKANLRKKDFKLFATRFNVPEKAILNIISKLIGKIEPWIDRYGEIGFDERNTANLQRESRLRIRNLQL